MKTAAPRLLPALIAVMLGFEPAAAAESPRHFEGSYHVAITPLERVHATCITCADSEPITSRTSD
jgi:hypothetical protein